MTRPPSQAVIEAAEQALRRQDLIDDRCGCEDPRCGENARLSEDIYMVARAAEQAADEKWMRWLIEQLHYGIDTSCEVDPPCTLADYAAMWERIDPREKHMAEVIVAETGAWADELTDTDDRSK